MVRVEPLAWIWWAAMILLVPGNWLLSAAAAACIHEAGHILSLLLLGGKVRGIRLGPLGAVIEGEGVSGPAAAVCTLAGPLGSFLTLLLLRPFPMLAVCGFLQGCFNLLPVYPLDGGRILAYLLERLVPDSCERIRRVLEHGFFTLLLTAVLCAAIRCRWAAGLFMLIPAVFIAGLRKKP